MYRYFDTFDINTYRIKAKPKTFFLRMYRYFYTFDVITYRYFDI